MPNSAPPARWYAPWRARAVDQDDAADYGTAYGLDMSLKPMPELRSDARSATAARSSWVPTWATRRRDPA